jgi:phosphate uptake regulator
MGEMSVAQLEAALDVLERRDDRAAERVIANDDAIDALEQQVNHDVLRLIRRGPDGTRPAGDPGRAAYRVGHRAHRRPTRPISPSVRWR